MIQYIVSDLDNTLFPENTQNVDPKILELIWKLKEKGILFIAASGRQYYNIRKIFAPVQDQIAYIAENGSLCVYDGEVLFRGGIDRNVALQIIEKSRTYPGGCNCIFSTETECFTDSEDPKFLNYMSQEMHFHITTVPDLTKLQKPVLKMALCNFQDPNELRSYFEPLFSDQIQVVTSGNVWLDFIALNANKGVGLTSLLDYMKLSPENGIAFGDQYNDVEILTLAGTGCVMRHCAPGMEQYADYIIDDVVPVLEEILKRS